MIKLDNGQWCYSPSLPAAYEGTGGYPPYRSDLPSWNMLYLTYPEEYEERMTARRFEKLAPPEEVAFIVAEVDPSRASLRLNTKLRDLATKSIPLFIHQFPSLELSTENAVELFDGKWVERVLANAKRIYEAHCEKADQVSVIDPTLANMILGRLRR